MNSVVEIRIPVPWGHISGKTYGNPSGRDVLCVHGWTDNAGTFDLLLPLLSEDLYFVSVDLPGHGQSSHLPPGISYNHIEFVVAIRRVVKTYLKWKTFDYIGHSLGAAIGSVYASLFPSEIRKLVMIDYAKMLTWENKRELTDFQTRCNEFLAMDRQKTGSFPVTGYPLSRLCELYVQVTDGGLNEVQSKILLKRGAIQLETDKWTLSRDVAVRNNGGLMRISHDSMFKILSSMRCDLLILKAINSGWDEPQEVSEAAIEIYKANCKSFSYIEVPGNHFLPLTNPTAIAPHINQFLFKT